MPLLDNLRRDIRLQADPVRAQNLRRFFKTGPGEYGEGDAFLGLTVPQVRLIAKKFFELTLSDLSVLVASEFHEERLCALLIVVRQYEKGDARARKMRYRWYVKNLSRVTNWDLVDLTAHRIVGAYMLETRASGAILTRLARSKNMWKRRVAIIATAAFIKGGRHVPTLNIARILLHDHEDLIHKAVGWMLREVGKQIGQETEEEFLSSCYKKMPRTMLRYAIERFPRRLREAYLDGRV